MPEWTNPAKAELERYCARVRESVRATGADVEEVVEDLKRHIDAEIQSAGLLIVTEDNLRSILARVGEPGKPNDPPETPRLIMPPRKVRRPVFGFILGLFGIVLPIFTIGFELTTRISAEVLIDPFPNILQLLMVSFVPLTNVVACIWLARGEGKKLELLGWMNGFAVGVSLCYALVYLPFMPYAFLGLLYFGAGLIPLTPAIVFLINLLVRVRINELAIREKKAPVPGFWPGSAVAIALLTMLTIPGPITRHFSKMASSESLVDATRGIHWLRLVGNEATLLRDCYGWSETFPAFVFWEPVKPEQAREIYYRVTGREFSSVPPPFHHSVFSDASFAGDFEWDAGRGGDAIAGRLKGLSLLSSRIDGLIEPEAALGYYEWTMEFKNLAANEQEARAQILLPSGGVVSRLTLWVNGEEREAAFAGRSQVKTAYQQVAIVQRRDPVLVTTCGPDRVLMQCFPVAAHGGTMKIRIGITAPLLLANTTTGRLRWPILLERNFGLPDGLRHSVWVESHLSLKAGLPALQTYTPRVGQNVLRADLTEAELNDANATVVAARPADAVEVWSSCDETNRIVRQRIVDRPTPAPSRVVVVVDGSANMKPFLPAIARCLNFLPERIESAILMGTDDEIGVTINPLQTTRPARDEAVQRLQHATLSGGQDNLPSLLRGWDLAAQSSNSVVLWIHGPCPMKLADVQALRQRLERQPGSPKLFEIQTKSGPNRIVEQLDGLRAVKSLPRLGDLKFDLEDVFKQWGGQAQTFDFVREKVERSSMDEHISVKEPSEHITRLWAYNNVLRLAGNRKLDEAAALAGSVHLVTPVSGAVVLETKAQFTQAGLIPTDAAKVPVVPEPSTWALIVLGGAIWLGRGYYQRRRSL